MKMLLLAIALAAPLPARAAEFIDPLPDAALQDLRGGFATPQGLLSFRIDLTGSIDGHTVYTASLTPQGWTIANSGTSGVTLSDGRIVALLQNGAGNAVTLGGSGYYGVVQNSVNGAQLSQTASMRFVLSSGLAGAAPVWPSRINGASFGR